MHLDAITAETVREALRALRHHRPQPPSPLLMSGLVRQRLATEGAADTTLARDWALGELLWHVIVEELERQRGTASPASSAQSKSDVSLADLARLRQDFATGRKDLEAWGLLAHVYLSLEPLQLQELAQTLSLVEKTLQRRLGRGYDLLAGALRTREIVAQARFAQEAEAMRVAPPAERVRVVGAGTVSSTGAAGAGDATAFATASSSAPAGRGGTMPPVLRAPVREAARALLSAIRGEGAGGAAYLSEVALREIASLPVDDLAAFRLGRFAAWSLPRYALDRRFVGLTLLVDQGEQAAERWLTQSQRFDDLRAVLAAAPDPALVLLGAPGSGKSTLLRRLELDLAAEGLRGESDTLTFYVRLAAYKPAAADTRPPAPLDWLAAEWSAHYPDLPLLSDLLCRRPMLLLLDGLNEMPHDGPRAYHERVGAWRGFLQELGPRHAGTRAIISCRSLDYSAPLSSPALRVPQVQVLPLDDGQIQTFLERQLAERGPILWRQLQGTAQWEVLRVPYFLRLLADQAESGKLPEGPTALFSGFVRQGLRRELERGNPLFLPGGVLAERDCSRLTSAANWRTPLELPERGQLVPRLGALAHGMQLTHRAAAGAQARMTYDDALSLIDDPLGEEILRAGNAITVLDDDRDRDEVAFFHQLLQEYFAARQLTKTPCPALVAAPWRSTDISPSVPQLLQELEVSETLSPLPQTGWEETTLMAVAMASDPTAQVAALMEVNLALAGRAAGQVELTGRLDDGLQEALRRALVYRSRSSDVDLRDRIACALALGRLGDPRWEQREGRTAAYLLPPLVDVPAGAYPIGEDEAITWAFGDAAGMATGHMPRHSVDVETFRIGRFPVTNAEWSCFVAAGGYQDLRWWETEDARRWLQGDLANEGAKASCRYWRQRFVTEEGLFEQMEAEGAFPDEAGRLRWKSWLTLDDAAFAAEMAERWKGNPVTLPAFWHDPRLNHPSVPVVGVSWFEARAYCAWLSAESGLVLRLPSEVEWEAAARGPGGQAFPWGDDDDAFRANTIDARIHRSTPVGVFVEGDSAWGAADCAGNVFEWTLSLWGPFDMEREATAFGYPYIKEDGRESTDAPPLVARILRGGSWSMDASYARCAYRYHYLPDLRANNVGLRVAAPPS